MKSAPWRERFRCSRTTRSSAFALSPCLRIRRCDKPAQARTEATEEIAQQIGSVQAPTEEAVNAIAEIVASMTQVNEYTTSIAAPVEQQSASTVEISRNAQEAAKGNQEVSATMNSVTSSVDETTQSADQVPQASADVAMLAEKLRPEIDRFPAEVESA